VYFSLTQSAYPIFIYQSKVDTGVFVFCGGNVVVENWEKKGEKVDLDA